MIESHGKNQCTMSKHSKNFSFVDYKSRMMHELCKNIPFLSKIT